MMVQADVVHKQPVSICIHWEPSFPLSLYVIYIYICRHVCTERKYVHTRNVFLPVNYTNTRTHTHTLGYFIHNSDPSKTLLNPFTSFTGVCMCMWFLSFHISYVFFSGTVACIENTPFFCACSSDFRSFSINSATERRRVLLWMIDHVNNWASSIWEYQ